MPYKIVSSGGRHCVHKENADGSAGKMMKCYGEKSQATAYLRALYANVEKEVPMSSAKVKRARRERAKTRRVQKQDPEEFLDDEELTEEQELALLESESEDVEKSYGEYEDMSEGPTSFEELESARAAEMKASMIRNLSWDVQDLVHNIIRSPMEGAQKSVAIKKVGDDFGARVTGIMDTRSEMLKESPDDIELLEAETLLAQDGRNTGFFEKAWNEIQKRTLSSSAREALPDSAFALPEKRKYPIHDKAHVRNALARAAQQIKAGGEAAEDAKAALPRIKAMAKKFGIGADEMNKESGIIIQKDANGDWRWVGWPSNNFIDRSQDILTEAAHLEYVDWWNKNKDDLGFPVFTSMHAPGTVRTYPVDFVGYENGFLVMSGKLTEAEAAGLMRVQKNYKVGMSHTGWGIRNPEDPRQIVAYRIYEVTDLPLEMADNPFTDLSVVMKEADMKKEDQKKYLAELLGSEELADKALSTKTAMKQAELQEAQVEQKQASEGAPATPPALDMTQLVEQLGKELDLEGLSAFVQKAQEELEKIPLLEGVIKQQAETIQKLSGDQNERLAEIISPPAAKFAWSQKKRESESQETIVKGDELEALKKTQAGIPAESDYWLSQVTNTAPVSQ